MIRAYIKKLLIVIVLITAGILLDFAGWLDAAKILLLAREYADHWWLVVVLILLQMVLFTFALAGSLVFWVAAPLYPPAMAAFILAAGATLGGIGAYFFSAYMTDEWIKKIENSQVYKLLHKQDNFFTLFALRIFPAFPHSLVNYSSGVLKVKLSHFIPAAFLGVGIKSYIYSDIIYNLTTTASIDDLLNVSTIAPLVLLSLITFLGVFINYKRTNKNKGA
jgi:uncharacterized membrane protein YdjX (TVP38/TMEM64 family)